MNNTIQRPPDPQNPATNGVGQPANAAQGTLSDGHRLIDGRAAARKAGCSHRHWLRLCEDGLAPVGIKLRALRRWDESEIDEWIAAGCPAIQQQEGSRR